MTRFSYISGIEISDVLKIDDKDYSITFSLYFNVQWSEPRLNLSAEFFDTGNHTGDDELLVPGKGSSINDVTHIWRFFDLALPSVTKVPPSLHYVIMDDSL